MKTLFACIAIFRVKLAESAQYRVALLSNSSVGIFWGLIEVTVYRVFFLYANNQAVVNTSALSLPQMISYIWLMQIILALTPHNVEGDIVEKINNGDIGIELCRPMALYAFWFSKTAASRIAPLFWRGVPVLIVALIMPAGMRLSGPASGAGLILMLVSCVFALFLCTAYAMLVTAVRMNVTWGDGPMYIILTFGLVFSGAFLPLQLWPDALQRMLLYQPFAGYLDIPVRLYIGTMPPKDAVFAFGLQIFWTAVFYGAGRLMMRGRLRKTVVQGG